MRLMALARIVLISCPCAMMRTSSARRKHAAPISRMGIIQGLMMRPNIIIEKGGIHGEYRIFSDVLCLPSGEAT